MASGVVEPIVTSTVVPVSVDCMSVVGFAVVDPGV